MPTEEQAKVYGIILDMIWKSLFSGAVLIAFCAVMYKVVTEPKWEWVAAETVLAGTMFVAFRHYFPTRDAK